MERRGVEQQASCRPGWSPPQHPGCSSAQEVWEGCQGLSLFHLLQTTQPALFRATKTFKIEIFLHNVQMFFSQMNCLVFACQHFRPGPDRISSFFYALGQQPSVMFGFLWSSILDPAKNLSTKACSNIQKAKHNVSYHSLLGLACDVQFDQNCGKYHYNRLFYFHG